MMGPPAADINRTSLSGVTTWIIALQQVMDEANATVADSRWWATLRNAGVLVADLQAAAAATALYMRPTVADVVSLQGARHAPLGGIGR
jgi:hypothetical protein